VKTLTLAEKLYGPRVNEGKQALLSILFELVKGLNLQVKVSEVSLRGWVSVQIDGQDMDVAENLVERVIGVTLGRLGAHHPSMNVKGRIVEGVEKDLGIYVDVGITEPESVDAFIPLSVLRRQLADGKNLGVEAVKELWSLQNRLPVYVHLTTVDADAMRVEAELSERQLSLFDEWVNVGLDRVLIAGTTVRRVKETMKLTHHLGDIVKIDRLGLLESSAVCKMGTDAPGIIHAVGKVLPDVSLRSFRPSKISKVLGKNDIVERCTIGLVGG